MQDDSEWSKSDVGDVGGDRLFVWKRVRVRWVNWNEMG